MPNIGALLKQEISRLSRRETRTQLEALKRASAQYRQGITALRRQVLALQREVARLSRQQARESAATPAAAEDAPRVRFSSRWLRPAREKLGLSAADYGRLAGVTAQSVYNWERGATEPRGAQLQVIAELRGIGKREARARLEALDAEKPAGAGKSRRKRAPGSATDEKPKRASARKATTEEKPKRASARKATTEEKPKRASARKAAAPRPGRRNAVATEKPKRKRAGDKPATTRPRRSGTGKAATAHPPRAPSPGDASPAPTED